MIKKEDFSPDLREAFDLLCDAVEPIAGFYPNSYGQAITLFAHPWVTGALARDDCTHMPEIMEALVEIGSALDFELEGISFEDAGAENPKNE